MNVNSSARSSAWTGIAMIITAAILAGAAVFITLQYNKTQWDIANLNKEAQIQAAGEIRDGLDDVGSGLCKTSTKQVLFC